MWQEGVGKGYKYGTGKKSVSDQSGMKVQFMSKEERPSSTDGERNQRGKRGGNVGEGENSHLPYLSRKRERGIFHTLGTNFWKREGEVPRIGKRTACMRA